MKRKVTPLSDVELRKAKPAEKDYKLSDGKGLYLLVTAGGGKYWRFDYSMDGKRKTAAFGTYPEVPLTVAREKRAAARELVAACIDPVAEKKRKEEQRRIHEENFKTVALEWHEHTRISGNWSTGYTDKTKSHLERYFFNAIGSKRLAEITTPILFELCSTIGKHSPYTAHRTKGIAEAVFAYAIIKGKADNNPAVSLRGTLPKLSHKHFAAPTKPAELTPLLVSIDNYTGSFIIKIALQILPQTMSRPGEIQHMEWNEINLDEALWIIPAIKMKRRKEHLVPLSRQVVELLKSIRPLTGENQFVFPSHRTPGRCISHNSFNEAFRYMGFSGSYVVSHGFRATARTMLHEILRFEPDVIEAQLAHRVPDRMGDTYNRALHIDERTRMLQAWSDYLDTLKTAWPHTIKTKST